MAIRNIEELRAGNSGGDARFAALLEEATRPELLTLALLLHDVGKEPRRTSCRPKHADGGRCTAAPVLSRGMHRGHLVFDPTTSVHDQGHIPEGSGGPEGDRPLRRPRRRSRSAPAALPSHLRGHQGRRARSPQGLDQGSPVAAVRVRVPEAHSGLWGGFGGRRNPGPPLQGSARRPRCPGFRKVPRGTSSQIRQNHPAFRNLRALPSGSRSEDRSARCGCG